jgi:predicted negative regulator of RcsB-dependent stress response
MPTLSPSDPVLESQVLWDRYKKEVFAVLVFALLTVAAWGGYRLYSDRRGDAAANVLAAAKTAADFQKVIGQYPGTAAAGSAYLFLAEEQRKEKQFSEANTTLQSFLDKYPAHELKGTARMAMGANLESLGKRDEALTVYQRLAADDPQGFAAPMAMISQVHIFKEKNQPEEAKRVCEAVLTQYRDSLLASEATRQLGLLKGNEPAKTLQLSPKNLTPDGKVAPSSLKPAAPPAAVPAGPPAAVPAAPPAAVPPAKEPKK